MSEHRSVSDSADGVGPGVEELVEPETSAGPACGEAALRRARHQIRNELQLLTSLTALHVRRVDEPRARRELVRCYRRIGVVGVVHQLTADAGGTVSADICLNTVADFIEASARTMEDARSFELDVDLAPLRWRHDHATRIALIVDELFANAMDHALPHCPNPTFVLTLAPVDGRACLCLRDFGPGLPEDFDPNRADTLGLPMASAVAQQLGGNLELGPAPGGGTEAKLWLPLDLPLEQGASA
jgi:two-component system, sensor histidine kinase PdtaS